MGKQKSALRERLTRAITGPPRIPVSRRPFEATTRPLPPRQPDSPGTGQPPATGQEATPPPTHEVRRPTTIRQRTTRSRQERLYEPAPTNTATARQAALLATFESTLSDLDDDNDDHNGVVTTAPEGPITSAQTPMPDSASLTIAGPGSSPSGTTSPVAPPPTTLPTPPPTPRPTPPPTPLPMTPVPPQPALLPITSAPPSTPPAPLPAPGYFTGPPPPESAPATPPPPGPPVPPAVAIPEGPFPEDALRTVPWDRIRPGQRYRHHVHGQKIVIRRRRDGSWLLK
ncbi:basic proline-rich protein-like [Monomorium pharaonis]|uniref:basic proline-rich protein-like n=1 Tax=Monomorium pharaonis TaxID=307658 RepID=UPI001746B60B|nr:basic proline-rich protein-like [Monomorium pharaonis]